jgi:hypothetical protein
MEGLTVDEINSLVETQDVEEEEIPDWVLAAYPEVLPGFEPCGMMKVDEDLIYTTEAYTSLLDKTLTFRDAIMKYQRKIQEMIRDLDALRALSTEKDQKISFWVSRYQMMIDQEEGRKADQRAKWKAAYQRRKSRLAKHEEEMAAEQALIANIMQEASDPEPEYDEYYEDESDGFEAVNTIVGLMPGSSTDGQGVTTVVDSVIMDSEVSQASDDISSGDVPTCEDDFKEWVLSQTVDRPRPQRVPGPSTLLQQFTQACEEEGIDASTCMMMGTKRKMEVPKKLVLTENDCKEAQSLIQEYSNGFVMKDLAQMLKKAPTKEALLKFRAIVDVKHVNWEAVGTRVWDTFPEPVAAKDPCHGYS